VFVTRRGGPEVLRLAERTVAAPGPDEIVVKVRAAGVAPGDVVLREGVCRDLPTPTIPGYDAAGLVIATGTNVADVQLGDHVAVRTVDGTGGYATHVLAPSWGAAVYPAHLPPESVTSLVLDYVTALQLLTRTAPIAEGSTILVHSAAGGVGNALLQLGALRGLRMFGAASGGNRSIVEAHGATPVDDRNETYLQRVRAECPDGIDAVFDAVGGANWKHGLSLLRPGGHLVLYGMSSGFKNRHRELLGIPSRVTRAPRTRYFKYISKSLGATGSTSSILIPSRHDWYRHDLAHLIGLLDEGKIAPAVQEMFPLESAADAHHALGAGRVTGKLVLIP
jgi:NADPH:quinone reductase-like Zn-dependent oxidoreductase